MKHKYALYPIIMSICAFLCFFGIGFLFGGAVEPRWGWILLLLLPAVLLAAVSVPAVKGIWKQGTTVVITTILVLLLVPASGFYTILLGFINSGETTDIRYYTRAYAVIEDEEGVEGIFPEMIPKFAADISFSYMPQVLQGGEVFELSYTTTDGDLSTWKSILEKKAEWIGTNQEWHEENNRSIPGPDLSTRYHLYWDGGYNHGEMSYVLIDEETNRITFYYSEW